jgi:hypothetical protein
MRKTIRQIAMILSLFVGISACASQRPVLSSNAQLMRAGAERAERDIDECIALAELAMKQRPEGSKVVTDTAASSVVGAAAGGAGGAVFGNAAQGAAAGAVGGAVASLMSAFLGWMFRHKPPDPSNQQFVDRCLREKGYEPAGWK